MTTSRSPRAFGLRDNRIVSKIFKEDCLAGMKKRLASGSIGVVVTSPPYNLGVRYSRYDDNKSNAGYLDWMQEVAQEIRRVLSEEGSLFLNVGGTPQNPWVPMDVAQQFRQHFVLQNTITWVKSIAIPKGSVGQYPAILDDIAVGHFKPVNSRRFLNHCHEFIFHFTKRGDVALDRLALGVPYQDKTNIGRWKRNRAALVAERRGQAAAQRADHPADKRCRGNTWFIPYETIRSRDSERPHPATFPVELAEMCLRLHGTSRIKQAMDPFSGLGSTAVACRRLNVPFVGFEIDAAYISESRRRLNLHRSLSVPSPVYGGGRGRGNKSNPRIAPLPHPLPQAGEEKSAEGN